MTKFRKFVSGMVTLTSATVMSGLGMVSNAYAAPLREASVQLADVRSTNSSQYVFTFRVASSTAILGFNYVFANRASGAVTTPDNFSAAGATLISFTKNGDPVPGSFNFSASAGSINLTSASGTGSNSANDTFILTVGGITNNTATVNGGNECDTVANSETCFVRMATHTTDNAGAFGSGNTIDSATATYTVIAPITVTATVDPALTFTVSGVADVNSFADTANISCPLANRVTSTATSISFGNVGLGVSGMRCGQQSLAVATNAANGYNVYHKFIGNDPLLNMMQGTITGNNIDPFPTGTFGTPAALGVPNGTASNVNSGWLGIRTSTIGGFGGDNLYAGPAVNNTATVGNAVMTSAGADLGTTPTAVTLKFIVNALQPADSYTGTMVYNVVARY
jgi:hypothetical protein